jgi:hypothetical protein
MTDRGGLGRREPQRPRRPAEQHRGVGPRQMRHAGGPRAGLGGKALRCEAIERQVSAQHVGGLGHPVLRHGDHQVEPVQRRPGSPDMHQPRATAALLSNPARHGHAAPAARQHQIGPGRRRRGAARIERRQRGAEQQVRHVVAPVEEQLLFLARPAERLRQHAKLGVVAALVAEQQPEPGLCRCCAIHGAACIRLTRASLSRVHRLWRGPRGSLRGAGFRPPIKERGL